jgi:hypothetical protein
MEMACGRAHQRGFSGSPSAAHLELDQVTGGDRFGECGGVRCRYGVRLNFGAAMLESHLYQQTKTM